MLKPSRVLSISELLNAEDASEHANTPSTANKKITASDDIEQANTPSNKKITAAAGGQELDLQCDYCPKAFRDACILR